MRRKGRRETVENGWRMEWSTSLGRSLSDVASGEEDGGGKGMEVSGSVMIIIKG